MLTNTRMLSSTQYDLFKPDISSRNTPLAIPGWVKIVAFHAELKSISSILHTHIIHVPLSSDVASNPLGQCIHVTQREENWS